MSRIRRTDVQRRRGNDNGFRLHGIGNGSLTEGANAKVARCGIPL
jgi:hypothetical protein